MTKKNKKLLKECDKYKKTAKKIKCDVDQYIKFSGAEKKKLSFIFIYFYFYF